MNNNPLLKAFQGWKTTGNSAVDAVANAVYEHRRCSKPLRSISLKPGAYELFVLFLIQTNGVENVLNHLGEVAAPIEFDSVQILKGSKLQLYNMMFDYFPTKEKQVEHWKEVKQDTGYFPEHINSGN